MSHFFLRTLGIAALVLGFQALAAADCPANGLAVVVNKGNPTEGISMTQLRRLLLGDLRNWPDKKAVSFIAPDAQSAAYRCMLSSVVRMTDAEYRRYLANAEFRGEEAMQLHTAGSGTAAAKLVSGSAGSIAIVEAGALPAISVSVHILRINGKQPGEAGYPL